MTPSAGSTWQCLDVRQGMEASGDPLEEKDGNLSQMLELQGGQPKGNTKEGRAEFRAQGGSL